MGARGGGRSSPRTRSQVDGGLRITPGGPSGIELAEVIDEEANLLFLRSGLRFAIDPDAPFLAAQAARWRAVAAGGGLWFAEVGGDVVGFGLVGRIDDDWHFEQLAVRPRAHRLGVGARLVEHVQRRAALAGARIVCTTYAHLPWNAPYYTRLGFFALGPASCGPDLRARLDAERAVLPAPEQRIAMGWVPSGPDDARARSSDRDGL